jgi:serine/threonine protein kinase
MTNSRAVLIVFLVILALLGVCSGPASAISTLPLVEPVALTPTLLVSSLPQPSPTPSNWPRDDELLLVRLNVSASSGSVNENDMLRLETGLQQFILGHYPSVHHAPPVTLTNYEPRVRIAVFMIQVPTRIASSVRIALTDWIDSGALSRAAAVNVTLVDENIPVYMAPSASPTPDTFLTGQKQARPVPTPAMPSPASNYLYMEATLYIRNLTLGEFTSLYSEQLKRWMANSTNGILDASQFYLTNLYAGSVYATYTAIVPRGVEAENATQGLQNYVNSGAMSGTAGVPITLVGGTVQTLGVAPTTSTLQGPGSGTGGAPPWVIAVATVLPVLGACLLGSGVGVWYLRQRRREREKAANAKPASDTDVERASGRSRSSEELFRPEPVPMDEDIANDSETGDTTPTIADSQQQQQANTVTSALGTPQQRRGAGGGDGGGGSSGSLRGPSSPAWAPVLVGHRCTQPDPEQSLVSARRRWCIDESELQILEHIGAGGFGSVHRALWRGTEVAVKRSLLDRALSAEELDEFLAECDIMANLRHPCIVQFFGAVVAPPNLCIVIELMPRGSLFDLLHTPADPSRRVRLPWRRRLAMMQDAARGMTYLHACHPPIIHRDLKSMNCLVSENWRVKISDFGLSRAKHRTFLTSRIAGGTPEWTAPEVIRNEPHNEKCDVYSFGVVAWEVITRRIPFAGLQPMQVLVAVAFQGLCLSMPLVPAGKQHEDKRAYVQLVNRCLQEQPQKRPSMAEVYQELVRIDRELRLRLESAGTPQYPPGRNATVSPTTGTTALEHCSAAGIADAGSADPSALTGTETTTTTTGRTALVRRYSPPLSLAPLDMSKLPPAL